jgi:hypothetical protein
MKIAEIYVRIYEHGTCRKVIKVIILDVFLSDKSIERIATSYN